MSHDVTIFIIIIIVIVILAAYEQQIYSPGCMICNVQFGCLCIVGTRERRLYRRRRSEIQKFRRRMATLGENMARKRFWIQSIRGTKLVRARKLVHALWILNNDYLTHSMFKAHEERLRKQFKKDPMTLIETALFIINFSFLSFKMFDQVSNHAQIWLSMHAGNRDWPVNYLLLIQR